MESLIQDIRYGARTLLQSRTFTILAVLCLAIGIGVNGMIFSVTDAIVIRPFPYKDPERIVRVYETQPKGGINRAGVSYQNLRDWREQNTVFSDIAGLTFRSLTISSGEDPQRYLGGVVSWNLFPLLGVEPVIGRGFREDDDRPGAAPVVLISHDVWVRHYGSDRSVVGRTVQVNTVAHTVVGVMPPRFQFPQNQRIWVSLTPLEHAGARSDRNLTVYARLKPGVDLDRARREIGALAAQVSRQYPGGEGWTASLESLREDFIPEEVKLVTLTMMGAVTLVLFIACANVANLLLARATARHREISIRAALGAGRGRIVRQLLTESVLIALFSVPLGIMLAYVGLTLLDRSLPPDEVPSYISWRLDARSLAYVIAVSVTTGFIFGLAPAAQASRGNLHEALKEGSRGSGAGARRNTLRSALVVAEVALSLVLLIGASLFVRSFLNLKGASGGFDTAPLMTMRFYMPGERYREAEPKAQRVEDIIRRIEGLPGVQAASASNLIPLGGGGDEGPIQIDGRAVPRSEEPFVTFAGVTPHFFKTLKVPLLRGRDFTDPEGAARTPVAVINQTMAKRFWPKEDPVGKRYRVNEPQQGDWMTVIGVVPDIRHDDINPDDRPYAAAYVPYRYSATPNTGLTIRVSGDPALVTTAARSAIRSSDPVLPVFEAQTMEELRQLGFWEFRLFGWMFSIFGAIALILAAVGVYGVLSYAVSQRTHEIGVRVALGADRPAVVQLVVGQGLRLAIVGIAVGLAGAFGITRVIKSLLYNVSPTDPLSFAAIALFLTGVAFLASYLPARRATAVDPMIALRVE
ncbi:MAG: ABC transporter permease [Acidobacteria bacterium]|nr:ABC transporter permease [Acidobacteriota bacterium]